MARRARKTRVAPQAEHGRLPGRAKAALLGILAATGLAIGVYEGGWLPAGAGEPEGGEAAAVAAGAGPPAVGAGVTELPATLPAAVAGIAWARDARDLIRRVIPPGAALAGKWKYIVFHHSATFAGGTAAFDEYHRKKFKDKNGVEYQFVIGNGTHTPDGAIEATSRWGRQLRSGHVKNPRRVPDSIAVCLVGDFTRQEVTPAQYDACLQLARTLMDACGIPVGRVTMHRAVDGSRHTECPGSRFPLERLKDELAQ